MTGQTNQQATRIKIAFIESHVHVLLYGVKFNGKIDIVQFIFIRCVVYFLE